MPLPTWQGHSESILRAPAQRESPLSPTYGSASLPGLHLNKSDPPGLSSFPCPSRAPADK